MLTVRIGCVTASSVVESGAGRQSALVQWNLDCYSRNPLGMTQRPAININRTTMKSSLVYSVLALACASAFNANAQSLDCAALANSAGLEPAGYAEQCLPGLNRGPVINSIEAPTDIGWNLTLRGDSRPANTFATFTLNNFAVQTQVGAATNPSIFALDFAPRATPSSPLPTLYAVTGSTAVPNPSTLGTINTTTGAFTPVAAVTGIGDGSASGLAIHPRTGEAYFSTFSATTGSNLYRLDLATGVATLIGNMTPNTAIIIDIAMNCDGQLYAHNIGDDSLYSVNPATGAVTLIGPHGLAANFAQGMDFDNDDGRLYGFIYTGGGTNQFGFFNLATGGFTSLATNSPLGEYEGTIATACPAQNSEVSIAKSSNLPADAGLGTQFDFILTASNAGPGPAAPAVITDVLSPRVSYVSTTCMNSGYDAATRTFTWTIPSLAAGANPSCNVRVAIGTRGPITNTATISAENDVDPANNAVTITIPGAAVIAVPTNNPWLLALLALAAAGVGTLMLRRRG